MEAPARAAATTRNGQASPPPRARGQDRWPATVAAPCQAAKLARPTSASLSHNKAKRADAQAVLGDAPPCLALSEALTENSSQAGWVLRPPRGTPPQGRSLAPRGRLGRARNDRAGAARSRGHLRRRRPGSPRRRCS